MRGSCGRDRERSRAASELLLLVRDVLAAEAAVLALLELLGGLLALVSRVVPVRALGANQVHVAFLDLHGRRRGSRRPARSWGLLDDLGDDSGAHGAAA